MVSISAGLSRTWHDPPMFRIAVPVDEPRRPRRVPLVDVAMLVLALISVGLLGYVVGAPVRALKSSPVISVSRWGRITGCSDGARSAVLR